MSEITRVLLVAADRTARTFLAHVIDAVGDTWLTVAGSPGEARTLLNAHRYGLLIATNYGIPPWLSLDVIPIERSYEAMFIGGYWEDDFVRECERRRLHCFRVPSHVDTLRGEITRVLGLARRAAADPPGPWHAIVEALAPTTANDTPQPEESGMSTNAVDVGPAVLDGVFDAMRIDTAWSVREPRAFAWWGHRLVQRVWAEPVRPSHDHQVVRVHAVTALLRDVRDTRETRSRLAALNAFTHLGALIQVPETDRVVRHTAACFHAGNRAWLRPLFLAAVGVQVADAHVEVDTLARVLGGKPDVSAHPSSGPRREPDDLLNLIPTVIAPAGSGISPWAEEDFKAAAELRSGPWVLANADAGGITAELAFTGNGPAAIAGRPETALLTVSSRDRHPQLGSGLLLGLELPFNVSAEEGADLAWMLNALETLADTSTHTLGAWCRAELIPRVCRPPRPGFMRWQPRPVRPRPDAAYAAEVLGRRHQPRSGCSTPIASVLRRFRADDEPHVAVEDLQE